MKHTLLLIIQALVALHFPTLVLAQTPPLPALIQAGLARIYGQDSKSISFTIEQTRPGVTASGVEVARTDDMLAIDVTPCATRKTIVSFIRPYRDTNISDEKCGYKVYPRLQVIQQ
jgi:hypothetical protein